MRFRTLSSGILILIILFLASMMSACQDSNIVSPDSEQEIQTMGAEEELTAEKGHRGVHIYTANIMGQVDDEGNRAVYAEDSATLRRTKNGVSFQVKMPTPAPGTYQYPEPGETATDDVGPPEAFSLWVFVFDPDQPPFNPDEGMNWSGAFLGSGHIVGGQNLTLNGHISTQTEPFAGSYLENPDTEIHLAIAPHGALSPELMPDQIQTPAGGQPIWWVAIFDELE